MMVKEEKVETVVGECFHCGGEKIMLHQTFSASLSPPELMISGPGGEGQVKKLTHTSIYCKNCKTLFLSE